MSDLPEGVQLTEALSQIATLQESMAELEQLHREDVGWSRLTGQAAQDLTPDGRRRISDLCEMMTIANPLIKRGFGLRRSYVWGAGHTLAVTTGEKDRDAAVQGVVQAMLDDDRNSASLSSQEAEEGLERWLYTHGAIALLLDTDPKTGGVVVRQEDPDHITDHITNPDDAQQVWYWRRQYTARPIRKDGTPGAAKTVTVWHPDIDHKPASAQRIDRIGGKEVRWDQPLLVRGVNKPAAAGWVWGVPDAYAALPWARMSKEFLEAWFTLMQALSRFAWRTSTRGGKAAADAARAARAAAAAAANPTGAGAHVFQSPGETLEAIPKTGATIDATSGQPLQQFVAAALDLPLTMLLADPGVTGARAVAETLDEPLRLSMGARRRFWGETLIRLAQHAIDAAITAGMLPAQADGTLPEGWSRTVVVSWPTFDSLPVDTLMKALRDADGMDKLPPLLLAREILRALGVEDADEWLEKITDGDGNLIPPEAFASAAQTEAERSGR